MDASPRDTTERPDAGTAERALRESEERFRELAENASEVFWLYEAATGATVYVSPAFERVWGRSPESLRDRPDSWLESVHPDDRERVSRFLGTLQGEPASIEYRIVRPDGAVRWLSVRGFPIRDASGRVVRIGGISEDVTEAKQSEERLRFLAEAGRALAGSLDYRETLRNVAHLAVPRVADWCVVDIVEQGRIARLAVAHTEARKEALVWEFARRYPPDMDAPSGVGRVIRTGEPQVIPEITEAVLRQSAQDALHYRLMADLGLRSAMTLPMIAHGRVLGAITFVAAESERRYEPEDVRFAEELAARAALAVDNALLYAAAEQARSEAELRAREEAALRRATEAVTATFRIDDVIDRIAASSIEATDADGAFVKRIDLEHGEVVVVAAAGARVPRLQSRARYHGSYTEQVIQAAEPLLVPDLAVPALQSADIMGACGDCSAMVVPLLDAGEAIGALVLTRLPHRRSFGTEDVARARTFADLASLAFRKVHLLHEAEQRRAELERVMESRERLVRGFSHDLKNPLGAAAGFLDLVESGVITDPVKVREAIHRARRAINGSLGLIRDLAELARAEAGQVEVRLDPVDLRRVVAEMGGEYRAQAEAKGLELRWELPDRLPLIESDSSRVRQILGNLISNAIKYTEAGDVRLHVELRAGEGVPRSGQGQWIAVDVADTGPGIPADQRHLLFREFSRLQPRSAEGTGLGLAISQHLATALAGTITVGDNQPQGAVFTLWLPVRGTAAG